MGQKTSLCHTCKKLELNKQINKKINLLNILETNLKSNDFIIKKEYYDTKLLDYLKKNNKNKYRDFIVLSDDNIDNYKQNIDNFYKYIKDCNNKCLKTIYLDNENIHFEKYNWIKYGLEKKLIEPKNIYNILDNLDLESDRNFGKSVFSLVYKYFMTMKEIDKEKNCADFFEFIILYFTKFFNDDDEWYKILLPQLLDKALEFIREYNALLGHILFEHFYPSLSNSNLKPIYRYYSVKEPKPFKINNLEYLKTKPIFNKFITNMLS